MPSSNKTGLVLKISLVLLILLATVVYKLNAYFKNEQTYTTESRLHQKVVLSKTAVSSQLAQLRNVLSSYESGLDDTSVNWVQLDPFFAIANIENNNNSLKVNKILVRSNTPAERWNASYLEKALLINKPQKNTPVLAQLFQDRSGNKFLILRFGIDQKKELAVVGRADYFQKFFDIERGEKSTALLVTTENVLVAHSEGDYIATQTKEAKLSKKKYLFEKAEIVGTNIIAMNYILKSKVSSDFAVPWSIVGVIVGFGFILVAIMFYSLDPLERKVERYKRQERAQIYKDTLGGLVSKSILPVLNPSIPNLVASTENRDADKDNDNNNKTEAPSSLQIEPPSVDQVESVEAVKEPEEKKMSLPKNFYSINQPEKESVMSSIDRIETEEVANEKSEQVFVQPHDQFLSLDDDKIDLADIEKALALDDFDSEDDSEASMERLKESLTPQTVSLSSVGGAIDKPDFELPQKEYKADSFDVNIRSPQRAVNKL